VAYIVPKREFQAAELELRCRASLASFKVPRRFIAVEKLPRTALGKIQKHLLPKP
jgi:malonyl-CoA/methylmalonyl-CoA synthetase